MMKRFSHYFAATLLAILVGGCAVGTEHEADLGRTARDVTIADVEGFLRFLNDREHVTREFLDVDCGIRSDSAKHIIWHRDGKPNNPEFNDFDSLEELLGVHMVGDWTAEQLYLCAVRFAYIGADGWEVALEEPQTGGSYAAVAAWDDGSAAMFRRNIIQTADGNQAASFFRFYQDGEWSWPIRLDGGFPDYPSQYGPGVKGIFEHHLVRLPSEGDSKRMVAGVVGRYSTAYMNSDGMLYALFLRVFDGSGWGDWKRVTPVGRVVNVAMDVDDGGRVWIAYRSSTNLEDGHVYLCWFDPDTGTVGPPAIVDTASRRSGFNAIKVTAAPGGDVWVTYPALDGSFARVRRAQGAWEARIRIPDQIVPHDATWADGKLWVVTGGYMGINLYRLHGNAFVADGSSVLVNEFEENDEMMESMEFGYPVIAPWPEEGLAIAVSRTYYFESFVEPYNDLVEEATVVVHQNAAGDRTRKTVYNDTWGNVGGAMVSTGSALWIAASSDSNLFVLRHEP